MRSVVVYYSLSGSTERVVRAIQRVEHADVFELQPKFKPCQKGLMRLVPMAVVAVLPFKARLSVAVPDLSQYDRIYVGGPVWFRRMNPFTRTFLQTVNLNEKIVIPFCTYDDQIGRYFDWMRRICPLVRFYYGMGFSRVVQLSDEALEEQVRVWINNINTV